MTDSDSSEVVRDMVDGLLPELTPYEATMYLFILRHTALNGGVPSLRIGKRTIAARFAKGSRGERSNFEHITKLLKGLESKGCLKIGDTTREGALYSLVLPRDVPSVAERLVSDAAANDDDDYFTNEERRQELFNRDKWRCQYCGESVTSKNATLDHFIPQSKGGTHAAENLRTACILCNSVKSGRLFEEAAPLLINSIRERKSRND